MSEKGGDIFEESGLYTEMHELSDKVMENLSDKEKDYFRKINSLLKFRENIFLERVKSANEEGYIQLNANVMDFCKDKCIEKNQEIFTQNEKKCLKNCTVKYLQQFRILNSFKNDYLAYFGVSLFLADEKQIKAMQKMGEIMKETHTNF
jgi:hypothetical protein